MQRKAVMLGLGVLLAAGIWLSGCGTSDLLDEVGQRYQANIAIQDNDEATLTVDVVQDLCDATFEGLEAELEFEDYGPVTAAVEFTLSADAPGVTLVGYTLEYIPLESADGTGAIVMPPELANPLHDGNLGIDIPAGGSASFEITCLSTDTKEEYRRGIGWLYAAESPDGQADLAAIAGQIAALQADINDTEADISETYADIVTATDAGDEAQVELLNQLLETQETQLETQETQLDTLYATYNQTYYSFYPDVSNPLYQLNEARYKIRITFEFEDEYGVSRTVSREATVWFGDYDNC